MVESVERHGYAGTTVRELVTLAGVSKSAFYDHFDGKHECFIATFDEIIRQAALMVEEAFRRPGDTRSRLIAALRAFVDIAVSEPAAAFLVTVESLTLGAPALAARERGWKRFEQMVQQTFAGSDSQRVVPHLFVVAVVGGLRGTLYHHLKEGRLEELPGLVDELADWVLSYQQADSALVGRAVAAAEPGHLAGGSTPPHPSLDWEELPDSATSRARLTQRERIVRAAGIVVVERGYSALSVPAISGTAGVSNQTFYENFGDKREAVLEAFDLLADGVFRSTIAASAGVEDPSERLGRGMRAYLEQVAINRHFARLAYFELPAAGHLALDRLGSAAERLVRILCPTALGEGRADPSRVVMDAIAAGVWSATQHELAQGRGHELPQLAPQIARIAAMPMG